MGILGRLNNLIKSNINDGLDKAEHPEKMLKQMIRDIDECVDAAQADAARILADIARFDREIEEKAREIAQWQERAQLALQQGNEEMARRALERKLGHEKELRQLEEQADQVRESAESLKADIARMRQKAGEARNKISALAARSGAAESAGRAQKALERLSAPSGAAARFDKIEREIGDIERMAQARKELAKIPGDTEKDFHELENKAAVESELATLKNRQG